MNAYCPECETDLDQSTGICPACRWDPLIAAAAQPVQQQPERELSLTERYRGTSFDVAAAEHAVDRSPVSRGRAFVVVSLVTGASLYALVVSVMGPVF